MKFKTYKGETLKDALVTLKIDGVRAHRKLEGVVSRSGKPLFNIPPIHDVCEVFLGTWEDTVSYVRTKGKEMLSEEFLFSLNPIDPRLVDGEYALLEKEKIDELMQKALDSGFEGLVIQSEGVLYKVKPKETYDVKVIGVVPGKGKHEGKMGALLTEMGKVGTGFTDEERGFDFLGHIIEVEAMSLTPKGKFRHPRFIRIRYDKE
jgi:hypothetical protein